MLCNGWAFRFFQLANGRRQILNFLIRGSDIRGDGVRGAPAFFRTGADGGASQRFSPLGDRVQFAENSDFSTALAQSCISGINDADALMTSLGQRSADERIAYLFCI
jgi:hypothetical protein